MAKINIPRLDIRQRGLKTYYYWNPSATLKKAGWKVTPLGQDRAAAQKKAEALNDQVDDWRAGGAKPRQVKKFIQSGTMDQLIARYTAERLPELAKTTQSTQSSILKTLSKWAGPEQVAHIDRARVRKLRDVLLKPDRDGVVRDYRASGIMRVLQSLMKWAAENGFLPEDSPNPAANHNMPTPAPRDQVWSIAAMDLMTHAAIEDGQPGLALALHLAREVGQREGDLLRLTVDKWVEIPRHKLNGEDFDRLADIGADGTRSVWGVRLRQNKGKVWVEIPIVGQTRRLMEEAADQSRRIGSLLLLQEYAVPLRFRNQLAFERDLIRQCEYLQLTPTEPMLAAMARDQREPRPWDVTRFQRAIARIRDTAADRARTRGDEDLAAEIEDLQFRDLRRTAVVWLGELGIEDHLIASITGHKLDRTRKILETYMPRTTKMAGKAIALRAERDPAKVKVDKAKEEKDHA